MTLAMSAVDIFVMPTASACSSPQRRLPPSVSGTSSCITAPGEVRPGHMMFAPPKTNLMAPRLPGAVLVGELVQELEGEIRALLELEEERDAVHDDDAHARRSFAIVI